MKRIMVKKAYLPTIDEARGISLEDIESLRWIPERHRKTFAQPISVSRSKKEGLGHTIPYELRAAKLEHGLPLPGLLDESGESINPQRDITGTWVGPSNLGTLLAPDFTFNPYKESGILLGTTESPHWWRTMEQGAKTHAGEGFQYGGFPKESFVEIPRPNNASPSDIEGTAYGLVTGKGKIVPQIAEFISQFPFEQGTNRWGQKMGAPLTEQELIDQNLITPLSYEQRIIDSPFVPNKIAGEPMDIAFQLLKDDNPLQHVEAFLNQLTPDDTGVERLGDYTVHFEGFTDMCNLSINPNCSAEQLHQEVWDDFDKRQGATPIHRGKWGTEENPTIYSVYHTPQEVQTGEPMNIAFQLLKAYDVEEVKRRLMDNGAYEDYVDYQIADAQPGMNRTLPRPYGLMSHKALNHLQHGWFEGDIRDMLDDPNFAFERDDEGRVIWSPHNLGWGNPEHANPEHMGFMIENKLEGKPVDFQEIQREVNLRKLENVPFELNEPQSSSFLGMKINPTSTTHFSTISAHGPTDTLEEVEGMRGRGFQDIYTGEPMDIALQLLKERVSPEAKQHKLEYDKQYESSPERVKYRELLNQERRKRGIYGSHDHMDVSHTQGNRLTLENEHANRARHFKDKGTLREL